MKIFKTFALSGLMLLGVLGAKAQAIVHVDVSDVQELTAENKASADKIIELDQQFDMDTANKEFAKLLKKNAKNKEQLVSTGKYFYDQNKAYCKQFAEQAYKLDPTYIPALKLMAAVCEMRADHGGAGQKFEEILMLDPNNTEVMLYVARVYKYVNPYVSQEYLDKVAAIDPNNMEVYRQRGDIAYSMDDYKEAAKSYETYFKGTDPKDLSVLSMENYAMSLVANQDFETCSKVCRTAQPLKENDLVLRRLTFISDMENRDTEAAKESIKYITENPYEYEDSLYIYRDYAYAASYAKGEGEYQQALDFYKKGIERDSTQYLAYKDMATLYRQLKQPTEAIECYQKYLDSRGDKADLTDLRGMVQCYIAAKEAAPTLAEKMPYVEKGDAICERIMTEKPDSYQGPWYRAQLWTLDTQNAEEKPFTYYKQVLDIIGENPDYDAQISRAATYLAFYYVKKNDATNCWTYTQKALKYDPENSVALQLKKALGK